MDSGSQGWTNAVNPAFSPVLYYTYASPGYRMLTMAPTTIARMYHSTANLMQVNLGFYLLPVYSEFNLTVVSESNIIYKSFQVTSIQFKTSDPES